MRLYRYRDYCRGLVVEGGWDFEGVGVEDLFFGAAGCWGLSAAALDWGSQTTL